MELFSGKCSVVKDTIGCWAINWSNAEEVKQKSLLFISVMSDKADFTTAEVVSQGVLESESSSTGGNSMLFNAEPINEEKARAFLHENAWPLGLQDALMKGLKKIPIRYIICDDSGSMTTNDGYRFEKYEDTRM